MDNEIEILLVEDNANDEMLTLRAFKSHSIVNHIHVVRDGAEALEYLNCTGAYADRINENPKVILLDLKLPLVNGIEVLEKLRSNPRTRLIPVVVLTQSNEDCDIVSAYTMGANSYVCKPEESEQFNGVAKHLAYYWLLLNRQPASSLVGSV